MTDGGLLVANNGHDALYRLAHLVRDVGDPVSPRGKLTHELRHFTVRILDPYDTLCTGMNANLNTGLYAMEALQLIGGFTDVGLLAKQSDRILTFTNDRGTLDGAYGPRLRPQLSAIVQRLKDDPDSRQGVAAIWNLDDVQRPKSKDYPCTLSLGFAIRRGKLDMHVSMRSNDVNWGFKGDIFQFSQLQLTVANLLEIDAGDYFHTSFSMHLYETSFGWVDGLQPESTTAFNHPRGIESSKYPSSAQQLAEDIARNLPADWAKLTIRERWYREAIG
jgi:thymidylate synthase